MDFPTPSGQPTTTPPLRPAMPSTTPMSNRDSDTIYTMPDKFMQTGGTTSVTPKAHSKTKTWVLIGVIAVAVVAIIGGVVYYVLSSLQQQAPAAAVVNTPVTNTVSTTATDEANTNNTNSLVTNGRLNSVNNSNANVNSNTNSNSNVNTNSATVNNTNSNTAVVNNNTNTSTVVPSKDTDKDNLTNEEETIFVTKADKPDTDNDGYLDGQEVVAGYDPNNAVSSGKLSSSSAVATYQSEDYGYTIQYPKNWLAQALAEETPNEMLFTSQAVDTAGQFVEVLVEDNPTGYAPADWYTQQTGGSEAELLPITTFGGLEGVLSPDGYNAYFTDNKQAYIVTYRFGSSTEVYFPSTFTFMAKSFTLVKGNKAATSNANQTNTATGANANSTNQ